jgi:hypothetical protein
MKSWINDRVFLEIITIGIMSRLLVMVIMYLGLTLRMDYRDTSDFNEPTQNLIVNGYSKWDGAWYARIATNGYTNEPNQHGQSDVAFFPLYPTLMTGLSYLVGDVYHAGFIISNVSFIVSLWILFLLIRDLSNYEMAKRTISIFAFFPFSFYFSAVYTESLFLLTPVLSFSFAHRGHWPSAVLFAAFAGATRTLGFTVTVGIFIMYLEQRNYRPDWKILWFVVASSGTFGYMTFLWLRFGDPLLFYKAQFAEGWIFNTGIIDFLYNLVKFTLPNFIVRGETNTAFLVSFMVLIAFLLFFINGKNKLPVPYLFWSFLIGFISIKGWYEFGRLSIVIFPIFYLMAIQIPKKMDQWILISFVSLGAILITAFGKGIWVA